MFCMKAIIETMVMQLCFNKTKGKLQLELQKTPF